MHPLRVAIRRGDGPADDETGRALLRAYFAGWGPLDDRAQAYVAAFPEPFACYLLAGERGLVCLREMAPGVGEVKRLYVVPAARRLGVARALMAAVVDEARALGYHTLRLDTPDRPSSPAIALYESLGWRRIPPWDDHPFPMTAFERDV